MYAIVIWKICYILKLTIIETLKVSTYVDTGNFGKIIIDFY